MECPNCKSLYNENDHIPRLLIQCGHSICEKCTNILFLNREIVCPDCNIVNKVSSIDVFPRNLALLLINKSHLKRMPTTPIEKFENQQANIKQTPVPNRESLKEESFLCPKHKKKIEGWFLEKLTYKWFFINTSIL